MKTSQVILTRRLTTGTSSSETDLGLDEHLHLFHVGRGVERKRQVHMQHIAECGACADDAQAKARIAQPARVEGVDVVVAPGAVGVEERNAASPMRNSHHTYRSVKYQSNPDWTGPPPRWRSDLSQPASTNSWAVEGDFQWVPCAAYGCALSTRQQRCALT